MIRHALAEERKDFARTGKDDHRRPLTDEGRRKMRQGAKGLRSLIPEIDLLATSLLTRSAQTGAILDTVYGGLKEVEIEELAPEAAPEDFLRWLRQRREDCIAIVGHEPGLSGLFALLLTGQPAGSRPFFRFRKGGAALLEFSGRPAAGTAKLCWVLTPAQLRTLSS